MKSKLEILAKLLQDKTITLDEFIILSEKEVQYIYQNYPYYIQPIQPTHYTLPITWCGATSGLSISTTSIQPTFTLTTN